MTVRPVVTLGWPGGVSVPVVDEAQERGGPSSQTQLMNAQETQQYRIMTNHCVCGVTVKEGVIVAAEPYAQKFLGKPLEELRAWVEKDGGKVEPAE
jgi:hypothetical protein